MADKSSVIEVEWSEVTAPRWKLTYQLDQQYNLTWNLDFSGAFIQLTAGMPFGEGELFAMSNLIMRRGETVA